MYVLKLKTEYSSLELASAFYTYILHTRIDINLEDIYFLYQENKKLYRIELNCIQDKTFEDIMSDSKIKEIENINDIVKANYFICAYIDNEEVNKDIRENAQICIIKNENEYQFE